MECLLGFCGPQLSGLRSQTQKSNSFELLLPMPALFV